MTDLDPDDRRYSDEEFEAIVRTAAELEREASRSRRGGLSLGEIRAIATEAGLDPDAVSRAARALAAQSRRTVHQHPSLADPAMEPRSSLRRNPVAPRGRTCLDRST